MTIKNYFRFCWVPIVLALTISMTFFDVYIVFDFTLFVLCLIVSTGHFYITHFFGAKYFVVHSPVKLDYWKIVSFSYIPFILSFWVAIIFDSPSEFNWDFSSLAYILLGTLISAILFAILTLKKVHMDLDTILALLAIIIIIGEISGSVLTWIILKIPYSY